MNKLIIATIIAVIIASTMVTSQTALATKDPYDSGFDHGCSDSHIYNTQDRYINQDEKGPSYHTQAFMNGYYDGFKECGLDNGVLIEDASYEDSFNSNDQEQNQAAYTTQKGECGLILIGDCNIGQQSRNNFANDADN